MATIVEYGDMFVLSSIASDITFTLYFSLLLQVKNAEQINEDSLSLFPMLVPKLGKVFIILIY